MRLLTGTSGYSYKEWLGHFYPEKLAAGEMLRYYADRFDTVEINNTFYRMPSEKVLAQWADETPERFTFTLKAPRRITHDQRLKESESTVVEFLRRCDALQGKLATILFQLPHYLKKDVPRLRDFLARLDRDKRVAFDFRNDTWHDDAVFDALREHGAMLCVTDNEEGDTPYVVTAECGYVRLRRTHYDEAELRAWAERIASHGLSCTYVYFMHEDEALGCRFASMLADAWRAREA
jgi:uncharacterized protein YecE (DUF72 family)